MVVLVSSSVSCQLFKNPLGAWTKATTKVETIEQKVQVNEDKVAAQAKQYIYAADTTLRFDPNPNKYSSLAQDFVGKAGITLGQPTMAETLFLRKMVSELLSTNEVLLNKGKKDLLALDKQLIELQEENANLQGQLVKAEDKVIAIGITNSELAQKWTTLTKIFWWMVYGFIFIFVIKILSAILPPPLNSIVGIISVPIGLIIKGIQACIPEAKHAAGVVAATTYNSTKLALSQVVEAIEELKVRKPEAAKELVPLLKDVTSKELTRPLITKVKEEMGYI